MGKSSPPAPPDPRETSAAQTGTNIGTAIANNYMGMVDQHTPYGSLTYSMVGGGSPVPEIETIRTPARTGGSRLLGDRAEGPSGTSVVYGGAQAGSTTYKVGDKSFNTLDAAKEYQATLGGGNTGGMSWTDPYTGKTYNIPKFTATQTLSPAEQAKLEANQQAGINLATLARDQSAFLNDYMAEPFSYDTGEHEAWALDLYGKLTGEDNSRQMEALRSQLVNQGLTIGSEAYDREMDRLVKSQNSGRDQFLLDAYNTGFNTALTERNQPINEITALLSGSQVNHPNFVNTPTSKIPTTDNAGLINDNYNQRLGIWQQEQQQKQQLMGGLFGLAAGGLSGGYF